MSRSASILVDPASFQSLCDALIAAGWRDSTPRRIRLLPAARLSLSHPDHIAGLQIYPVIPGFFADPEETFDLIWERHKEVPLRGHTIRALGRINSAILASHDGLDGRASRARSNFDFFVSQFSRVLDDRERAIAVDYIRRMGGCAEMHRLIVALGEAPCPFSLPTVAYVQWRLQITEVSDQLVARWQCWNWDRRVAGSSTRRSRGVPTPSLRWCFPRSEFRARWSTFSAHDAGGPGRLREPGPSFRATRCWFGCGR